MKSCLIAALIIIFFGSILVFGQNKKEADFLQFSVKEKDKKICFGDSVKFTADFKNSSKNSVVIDINQIGSMFSFERYISKYRKEPYGSFAEGVGLASHYKPNLIVLKPMESHNKNLEFVFGDDYFKKVGRYEMQIEYRQALDIRFENIDAWQGVIFSNKIFIIVKECKIPRGLDEKLN